MSPLTIFRRPLARTSRWVLAAALLSVIALQVVSADHWHGIDDTEHCVVCLTGLDAPHTATPAAAPVLRVESSVFPPVVVQTANRQPRTTGNRDPPVLQY